MYAVFAHPIRVLAVLGVVILANPDDTTASNTFGTFGVGCGASHVWDSGPLEFRAVVGAITYCPTRASLTLRVVGANGLARKFGTADETAIEVALLGGYDYFFGNSVSFSYRAGLGLNCFLEKQQPPFYETYWENKYQGETWPIYQHQESEKEVPRLALQVDVFYKRVGLSYMTHFLATDSFNFLFLCYRFGNISSRNASHE